MSVIEQAGAAIAPRRGAARIHDFVALTKPRVMSLVMFTAMVGYTVAPGLRDALTGCIVLLSIAFGAGGAGALNMWYEADLDAAMTRTAGRPLPRGRVSRPEALAFGLALGAAGVAILGLVNVAAAALLASTVFFYVVIYTMWLKRRTPQNMVIGWLAATGSVGLEPLLLFLIIMLWTPPHFWALSLDRADEYARAGIPMLPVVAGAATTKRQILVYSAMLATASLLPFALGFTGALYGAVACSCGAALLHRAIRLYTGSTDSEARLARRLFAFSILYLFLLFSGLLADTMLL